MTNDVSSDFLLVHEIDIKIKIGYGKNNDWVFAKICAGGRIKKRKKKYISFWNQLQYIYWDLI
jgi:hypothetical protein